MFDISKRLLYYKRREIQKAIINAAKNREVGIKYEKGFGKRPDILVYEKEIIDSVKKGAISFHISEERWINPLNLSSEMRVQELNDLRKGWDLVLDIDCPNWAYAKLTAYLFVKALRLHGIVSIGCKFSGNKGFHIGVPFEAFPKEVNNLHIKEWFPDGPRRIAIYLVGYISKNLIETNDSEIIFDKKYKTTLEKISEATGIKQHKFDPLSIIEIDTLLISSRHMYRSPFSLHEKSGLTSLPIDPDKIMEFEKKQADPKNIKDIIPFLDVSKVKENEALQLVISAFDYDKEDIEYKRLYDKEAQKSKKKNYELPEQAITEEYFPESIKKGLLGLKDGKKRFLFILINFLRSSGWSDKNIEERVIEWNKKNPEPLKENYLTGQLRYMKQNKEVVPPPNYSTGYYRDLGIAESENITRMYKNPVAYARRLYEQNNEQNKKKSRKLTDEQKEMRKKFREKLRKVKKEKEEQSNK
ncbi:MAG: DNA primase small subunit domain-containing protein [Nanoarchaeota archaeon]